MNDEKHNPEENDDVRLYQKIADRTAEILQEGRKSIDDALKKASEEIAAGGDFTREQAEKIGNYVRRDLTEVGVKIKQARETVINAAEPHRLAAGVQSGLARLLNAAADVLTDFAQRSEKVLEFHTGEVTSPGTLTCKGCGKEMHLRATVRIPPCPGCHKTIFRKSY
ncbi:MAG: zinc ribbon-containing protein [Deltaproteobacteria bacterium]|nr:zinc ribbon-containing protein [Deltaproteobacteria bacterium]NCP03640.1 zinc ribbon-containing protein [Deltaproteobacteria bacterium]